MHESEHLGLLHDLTILFTSSKSKFHGIIGGIVWCRTTPKVNAG